MNENILLSLVKYFAIGGVLILLLKYIPNLPLSYLDITTILILVVAAQFLLDFLCSMKLESKCNCDNVIEDFDTTNIDDKIENNKRMETKADDIKVPNGGDDGTEGSETTITKNPVTRKNGYICEQGPGTPNLASPDGRNGCTPVQPPNADNDMGFEQLGYDKYQPMGQIRNPNRRSYRKNNRYIGEYGDWYIPPEEWYPPCAKPPVCITNNGCPVQPVLTSGNYAELRDFDDVRKVMQDQINLPYVSKLNGTTPETTNKDVNAKIQRLQESNKKKEEQYNQ